MSIGGKGATGSVGSVIDTATQVFTSIHGGNGDTGETGITNVNSTGGGGGGGAGIQSSAAIIILGTGSVFGGNGTAGSLVAGGGGGVGIFSSADVSIEAGGIIIGGNGGGTALSSAGGQGAAGIMLSSKSTIENSGTIKGGAGGRGGLNSGGGDGSAAIEMLAGGRIFNSETGIIQGGDGGIGRAGLSAVTPLTPGTGGAGINGVNITIVNAGFIGAGAGGTATGWTPISDPAIHFTSGENTLALWSTSTISGGILANGDSDRLILAGITDGIFDTSLLGVGQQYIGFESFEKSDSSVWNLNNSTNEVTPWFISQGTLSISSDHSLGDLTGILTLNGGTLQTTADKTTGRDVILTGGGGTIETAVGTEFSSAGVFFGFGSLNKTGTGKLTLSGASTYTGETIIADGTLSLSGDGDISQSSRLNVWGAFDISEATDVSIRSLTGDGLVEVNVNSLTVSHANDTYSGSLSGTGTFKLLSGSQILDGNSTTYAGEINISGGALTVDGVVGGTMNVFGGLLQGSGTVGTTTNFSDGTIAPGASIGALTINGDYHSEGGALAIDAELGNDNSPADQLIITGNAYLGAAKTTVHVTNLNGLAATTEGIKIIKVGGASDDAFSLEGNFTTQDGAQAVVAGAYAYRLHQGNGTTTNANDWYLRSALKEIPTSPEVPGVDTNIPEYQPGVVIYEAYPQILQGLNQASSLQQRISKRVWFNNGNRSISNEPDNINPTYATPRNSNIAIETNGIWARMEGALNHVNSHSSTTGADYRQNYIKLQTGIEGLLTEPAGGSLLGGVILQYVHSKADVKSRNYANGDISTDGYGLGGTLTWYSNGGFYIDGQVQTTWYKSDLTTQAIGAPSLQNGNNGFGYTLSIEAGQYIEMSSSWSVNPQTQLVYSNIAFDDFVDGFGSNVSLNKGDRLQSRFGLSLNNEIFW
ncbi:autotransporter outer membrane beta-barrel domain-containing protein [Ochrobactrum sp. Marseille-Q0166]|uniref:autotransporter family protein n=1 Tax=Ochrobactrum sp. Marseille-Q0166 TaxID=2761105 RepID=UPI0016556EB8|nr:autotransporter outer membrane beta-barrel domain-containing protein [Ochrobactrum sp. Marseille-Q0166]MBC8718998.1 autotransporter outer membrane beta-barrel domain-containing protein [Ochrobactrum sp. Marseille-Q0166]